MRKCDNLLKKSIMAKGKLVNQVRNILFRSGDTHLRIGSKRQNDDENNNDPAPKRFISGMV